MNWIPLRHKDHKKTKSSYNIAGKEEMSTLSSNRFSPLDNLKVNREDEEIRVNNKVNLTSTSTYQNLVWIFFLLYTTCPAHLILLVLITLIVFGKECKLWNPPVCSFLQHAFKSLLLGSDVLLSTPFSKTLSLSDSLSVRDQVSALVLCIAVVMMFRWWTRREKPLKQMIASICHI
jgi:hypothetical protein